MSINNHGDMSGVILQRFRYRWVIFAVCACNGVLLYFHYAWGATLSGYHTTDWNLSARQLGLLAASGFLPYALVQIPGGYLTDRFGTRGVLSSSVTCLALGTALFANAQTFLIALIGRTIIGASSGIIMLPVINVLARWFRVREFATTMGTLILLSNIGPLLGTWPLAVAAERWGWRTPIWFVSGITAIIALATWILLRNDPTDRGLPSLSVIDPSAQKSDYKTPNERPSLRIALRTWISVPTYWATFMIFFATFGSLQAFQALWAGPLLRHVRGLSTTETGTALVTFTPGTGLGSMLAGYISDKVVKARRPVVIWASIFQAALWIFLIVSFNRIPLPALYTVFVLLSALSGGVLVAQVIIKELCPTHLFGTLFGIHNGSGFYGTATLQIITGLILSTIGPMRIEVEPIYSAQSYALALSPIILVTLLAAVLSFRLVETLGPRGTVLPKEH